PAVDIPYTEFTLDNGLRVVVHEDRKAPVVAVSVWYHVGSKDEPEGKTGFAHLFEHLMFNGSEHHDGEYFKPLEEVGVTDVNGTTWLDRTNYFETVPTPALERVLFLESDRMGHLLGAVTQEKLDNQRGVVQNEKRQGENQPYGRAFDRLQEGIFPVGHPYHHSTIGSMEDLNAASLEDVKTWFRTYYGPNNAVLVLAGDISAEEAKPLVEAYFGSIPAGPPLTKARAWVPEHEDNVHETMQDRVPQARIYRVWAIPGRTDKDATILDVAGQILGGGKTSRLYKDLVYERQIATGVQAGVFPFELSSLFFIQVDVKPGESVAEANARLDAVLADFLASAPAADEVARAKTGLVADAVKGLEKVGGFGGKAVTLAQGAVYADDPGFFKQELAWVEGATARDIQAAAATWLRRGYYQLDVLPFASYSASKEDVDRTAGLPKVESTPDLDFPAIEEATLSNGMKVVLAERHAVPLVNVAVSFDAGYAADAVGAKLGTASLTLDMLDEGTSSRSALDIAAELESLGATLRTGSNLDTSQVTMVALGSRLGASLDLLADVVENPAFDEKELERLRQQRIARIQQEMNQPVAIALRLLPPILYGDDHAYGIPFTGSGTIESVKAITRDDLAAFHKAWLRPDNATIFVVGDTTMAAIQPLLESVFGDWQAPAEPLPHKVIDPVEGPQASRIIIVDRPGSPQSLILAGELAPPTGVENNIAIEAMNDILGGQFTARVNMNLREDKGWSYGAFTFMQDARGQRPFFLYAPVQTDKTAVSIAEAIKELKAITDGKPPTPEELDRTVKNNVRSLPGRFETSGAVLGAMLSNARFGRPLDYEESLKERYEGLTLADIEAAAKEIVHPERLVWIVVGDRAKIEDSVKALGIGPVETR
ncbi:MAG: insulinase family protein, partial [Alphaproteobacteria bacterium]